MPRGRPSEASEYQRGPFIPRDRPEPPADLEPVEAADEWRAITERLPADWFTAENLPLLRELCAHLVYAKRVRSEIETVKLACEAEGARWGLEPKWMAKVSTLFAEHRFQSQSIAMLSAKLRLTNQSRYAPMKAEDERAKVAAMAPMKPWEDFGEEMRQ